MHINLFFMKKIIFSTAFLLVLCIAQAQYKPFQFGFRLSPNINWVKSDAKGISGGDKKLALNWGFLGNFYFIENYGISTGFNVMRFNSTFNYSTETIKNERKIKVNCVEIPILFHMRTDTFADRWRLYGDVGYGFGILFGNNDESTPELGYDPYDYKYRHSFIIGAGVEYRVFKSSVATLGLVYDNNFSDISDAKNNSHHQFKIDNFALQLGFLF